MFLGHYGTFAANLNSYAALYHGVCERDWFHARARTYPTTLEAALHGNDIPRAVVDTLISVARNGTEPVRRYHRLRKRLLGLAHYYPYDFSIPLVEWDRKYHYADALEPIVDSVATLGAMPGAPEAGVPRALG